MKEFQNNAYFWQKIDTLCLSGDYIESYKAGDTHPIRSELVYPLSYGYYKACNNENEAEIGFHCFKGEHGYDPVGIVVSADILHKDIEAKLLIGVNDEEIEKVLLFLNQSSFQKTIYIGRGNDIPYWAQSE